MRHCTLNFVISLQLVYKNGQDYLSCAVVQYANPHHAENVRSQLNKSKIDTKIIHISYVAPGVNKIKEVLDKVALVEVSSCDLVLMEELYTNVIAGDCLLE